MNHYPEEIFELGDGRAIMVPGPPPGRTAPWRNIGSSLTLSRGQTEQIITTHTRDLPGTYTLCLTRADVGEGKDGPNVAGNVDAGLVAHISFGAEGAMETDVRVDWVNGLMIHIPAGSMQIRCEYPAVQGFAVDLKQQVGCLIAPATRAPSAGGLPQARLTDRPVGIVAGATQTFPCPPRSHAVRLITMRPDLYGSFTVGFSPTLKIDDYFRMIPGDSDEMPLGNGVRAVNVQNNAAFSVLLGLIWSIAL